MLGESGDLSGAHRLVEADLSSKAVCQVSSGLPLGVTLAHESSLIPSPFN